MVFRFPPDLEKLLLDEMSAGDYASPEALFRDALAALRERRDDLAAIRAGIADMEAGRVRPFDDVAAEIRARHGFSGT